MGKRDFILFGIGLIVLGLLFAFMLGRVQKNATEIDQLQTEVQRDESPKPRMSHGRHCMPILGKLFAPRRC